MAVPPAKANPELKTSIPSTRDAHVLQAPALARGLAIHSPQRTRISKSIVHTSAGLALPATRQRGSPSRLPSHQPSSLLRSCTLHDVHVLIRSIICLYLVAAVLPGLAALVLLRSSCPLPVASSPALLLPSVYIPGSACIGLESAALAARNRSTTRPSFGPRSPSTLPARRRNHTRNIISPVLISAPLFIPDCPPSSPIRQLRVAGFWLIRASFPRPPTYFLEAGRSTLHLIGRCNRV
jgi:hypothetical protein